MQGAIWLSLPDTHPSWRPSCGRMEWVEQPHLVIVPTQITVLYARPGKVEGAHSIHLPNVQAEGPPHGAECTQVCVCWPMKMPAVFQGEAGSLSGAASLPFPVPLWERGTFEGVGDRLIWACFVYERSLSRLRWLFRKPWNGFRFNISFSIIHFCQQLFLTNNAT